MRDQFLVEAALAGIAELGELNRLFAAWVEQIYHRQVHSETGQSPLERFEAAGPPSLVELHEAFLWSERRLVTKTATVSLHGDHHEVDNLEPQRPRRRVGGCRRRPEAADGRSTVPATASAADAAQTPTAHRTDRHRQPPP